MLRFSPAWVKEPACGGGMEDAELVPVHRPPPPPCSYLFRASSASAASAVAASSARNFSASSAAMQPRPAAVTAWRKIVVGHVAGGEDAGNAGRRRIRARSRYSRTASCGAGRRPASTDGAWPIATKTPSALSSVIAPVLRLRRSTPVTDGGGPAEPTTSSTTRVPDHLDLVVGEQPVLQDLLGAERDRAGGPPSPCWRNG